MYTCPQCGRKFNKKTEEHFYKNSCSSDGFHTYCKKCVKANSTESRQQLSAKRKHNKLLNLAVEGIKQRARMDNKPPSWSAMRFKELMGMTTIELDEFVNPHKYGNKRFSRSKKKKVRKFVKDCGFRKDFHVETVDTIYSAYCRYAKDNGFCPCDKRLFGEALLSMSWIFKTRRRVNGKLTYMYQGLCLKQTA